MSNDKKEAREAAYQAAYSDVMERAPQELDDYRYLFTRGYNEGYGAGRANAEPVPWVPVSERLPDTDGGYLITDIEGFMLVSYFQTKQQRFVVVQDDLAADTVAWMPLPLPYAPDTTPETKTDG